MDKERKKRLHTWKIILTDTIIAVLAIALAVVLVFIAMGYKFGNDGKLDQSGLLRAESTPTGATVIIDNETMFLHTNMNHLLPEGNHQVRLEREGYIPWENTIAVKSGRLYNLNYPRLFKAEREAKTVKDFGKATLNFFLISPDRKNILYQIADSPNWSVMRIDQDNPEITEFDASSIPGESGGVVWSNSSDKILVGNRLIDLGKPDQILEINKEFGLDFTKLRFINNSELLGLENGNLHKISINDRAVSRVLLDKVADFYNDDQEIVYVSEKNETSGKRLVGLYQDDKKTKTIKKTTADKVSVLTSEYLDEQYFGIASDKKLEIFRDEEVVAKAELDFVPEEATIQGRLMVFSAQSAETGAKLAVFDPERGEIFNFELESQDFSWLDDYLIGNSVHNDNANGKLYARDFDGTNKRELVSSGVSNANAVISRNNKWLYYLVLENGSEFKLKREEL